MPVIGKRQSDRDFMRELVLRMAAIREDMREIAAELRDFRGEWREEQRVTHKALFAMIDRVGPGGAAPA